MKGRSIELFMNDHRTRSGSVPAKSMFGRISWSARRGLVWRIRDGAIEDRLRRTVQDRIKHGRYYIVAAVRSGYRVSGMQFERVDATVPEVLRCIHADRDLWKQVYMGRRFTAVYREGKRDE